MAEFGELLLELRKDHNLSQAELGKIIFVSGGTGLQSEVFLE